MAKVIHRSQITITREKGPPGKPRSKVLANRFFMVSTVVLKISIKLNQKRSRNGVKSMFDP